MWWRGWVRKWRAWSLKPYLKIQLLSRNLKISRRVVVEMGFGGGHSRAGEVCAKVLRYEAAW